MLAMCAMQESVSGPGCFVLRKQGMFENGRV